MRRKRKRPCEMNAEEIHEWVARQKRIMKMLLLPCQITIGAIFYALFLWLFLTR